MKKIYIFGIALFLVNTANAQTFQPTNVISTAIPSMQIYADPRSAGMGYTGLATSPDVNSGFVNLSKIVFAKQPSAIALNYTPWMSSVAPGMFLAGASAYQQIEDNQAFSSSFRFFNLGNFDLRNDEGTLLQYSSPHELLFDVGYIRKLSPTFSLAVAGRYYNSSLATGTIGTSNYHAANGGAADVSLYYNGLNDGEGFTGGFALTNIGSRASYTSTANKEFIPANAGIGLAYTSKMDGLNKVQIALDMNKLLVPALPEDSTGNSKYYSQGLISSYGNSFSNSNWRFAIGAEYTYDDVFNIRAGYLYETQNMSQRNGFSTGIGFRFSNTKANIAYILPSGDGLTRNPLSNTLLFGVAFDLGHQK